MKDLPNLDFLRSMAVISVVVEHTLLAYGVKTLAGWQVAWIGVVGVLLFFVHTSLVLMWSLERKPHTLDFYIRRAFRIYPLLLLAIAVTLCFRVPVGGDVDRYFRYAPPPSRSSVVAACALVSNLFHSYTPMSVMWSLPYEVQMYLGLPVLFFFIQRNFSLWPMLAFWLFTVALGFSLFPGSGQNFLLCVPYFLPGIMAYIGFGRHRPFLPAWLFFPALLSAWAMFLRHPGWKRADILCLGAGLCLPLFRQIKATSIVTASREVAKYSYGIYLAHPFAIVLGIYCLPRQPVALQLAIVLASLGVFCVTAHHLLEGPMIRLGSRLAARAERRYEQKQLAHFRIPEAEI